jgi:hypothetical protein
MGQALSWGRSLPSPAWTLVTPYCKRTQPGRGTNMKAAGFPPLSRWSPAASLLPPFTLAHALDPSGLGHAATLTRRPEGPPGLETPTLLPQLVLTKQFLRTTHQVGTALGKAMPSMSQLSNLMLLLQRVIRMKENQLVT